MLLFPIQTPERPLRALHLRMQACCKTHAVPLCGLGHWSGRRARRWHPTNDQPCSTPTPVRASLTQGKPCAVTPCLRKAAGGLAAVSAVFSTTRLLAGWLSLIGCLGLAGGRVWAAPAAPAVQASMRPAVERAGPAVSLAADAKGLALPTACPGPVLRFKRLAPGLWLVPGFSGEADGLNRGQVSNLVLARQAGRLWALGSGPTPAFGQALACQALQRLGLQLTDVISPWARPELVLGVAGVAQAAAAQGLALRHWALAEVAGAMAAQCPRCVERLQQRLQSAADDLGAAPISPPNRLLAGAQGRLGPFRWWRLPRSEGGWVTVWRVQDTALWVAPGLLDNSGPPDGRDADLALLQRSSQQLAGLAAADGPAARFVGEQGPVMDSGAPARHAAYWAVLLAAVAAAIERGDDESAPAPALAGFPAAWAQHPWHSFNWQRAWRQVETRLLEAPSR